MTPQEQEFINIPGVQYGDCMRACVASILDLHISEVPHFLRESKGDPEGFWNGIYDFCEARGLGYLPVQAEFNPTRAADFGGYHIIGGPSPRGGGLLHAVVGFNGAIAFDPHPSKAGLAGAPKSWTFDYVVRL